MMPVIFCVPVARSCACSRGGGVGGEGAKEMLLGLYLICGMPVLVDPCQPRLARPLIVVSQASKSAACDAHAPNLPARPHDRTHARTHARTHTNSHAYTHARTHIRTHTRTHARAHATAHAMRDLGVIDVANADDSQNDAGDGRCFNAEVVSELCTCKPRSIYS
jgi:hypothetical protein